MARSIAEDANATLSQALFIKTKTAANNLPQREMYWSSI
jgi:hypothetical protein